jgi:hypothetical protein
MSTIKKSQHYVWRNYLKAWANNEHIWTFLRKQNKVISTNLQNVAQSNYYYKLNDINDFEEKILKEFIRKSPKSVQAWQHDFLSMFTIHTKLKKAFKKSKSQEILEEIKKIEINSMENAHSKIEYSGEKLIACKTFEDLKFIEQTNSRFDAIMFLCFQYFRTKNLKNRIKESFKTDSSFPALNIWNILSFFLALNTAEYISLNPKTRFLFIKNTTSKALISSDQPVINLQSHKVDENGEVLDLELYYPLSPNSAVVIDFNNNGKERSKKIEIKEDMVNWYNSKIIADYDNFIFSNNKTQLDILLKTSP